MEFLQRILELKIFWPLYIPVLIVIITLSVMNKPTQPSLPTPASSTNPIHTPEKMIKDVGEPYLTNFGLVVEDFKRIRDAGFTLIQSNFDICAGEEDVTFFLDQSQKHGLKVILPAGSGEAEWGYACDVEPTPEQKPVWQQEKVQEWVRRWKSHPALFAWDTSNEAGGNFPNGSNDALKLTLEQMQQAYRDVKAADPNHPVMIRMNGWYFYDYEDNFFRIGNPFSEGVADIVMINAYSNVDEYFPDFVTTVVSRARAAVQAVDSDTKIIVALGAWEEPPLWRLPSDAQLKRDYEQAQTFEGLAGIAYFKYGASVGDGWFLPDKTRGSVRIWQLLKSLY